MSDGAAPTSHRSGARPIAGVAALLAMALLLRMWNIGWALPATYHPDEHQYVDSAVGMLGGDLNPQRFNNPSLLKYVNAAAFAVWAGVGLAPGSSGPGDLEGFRLAFEDDPSGAYLLARALVALFGSLTVLPVYALARRLTGGDHTAGLIAGGLLAVTFLHVRDSHFAVSDVPGALLATTVLVCALAVLDGGRERTRALYIGGLLTGLATATKYSLLAVSLPLGLAWLLAPGRGPGPESRGRAGRRVTSADLGRAAHRLVDRRLVIAALLGAAAFLAAVPFSVLDRAAFTQDLATLAERGRTGFKGLQIDPAPGWIFYAKSLLWGMGPALLATSAAGLAQALWSRRRADLVVASLPLAMWGYLGSQKLMFARFMIPVLPALCALAAAFIVRLVSRSGVPRNRQTSLAWSLAAVVAASSLWSSIAFDRLIGRPDTRTSAEAWIGSNIPQGSSILVQSNGPELTRLSRAPHGEGDPLYRIEKIGTLDLPERPLDEWRAEGWKYLVTSSFSTERRLLDPARDAEHRAYYALLRDELEPLVEFAPQSDGPPPRFVFAQIYGPATELGRLERPGPVVTIYRLADR